MKSCENGPCSLTQRFFGQCLFFFFLLHEKDHLNELTLNGAWGSRSIMILATKCRFLEGKRVIFQVASFKTQDLFNRTSVQSRCILLILNDLMKIMDNMQSLSYKK